MKPLSILVIEDDGRIPPTIVEGLARVGIPVNLTFREPSKKEGAELMGLAELRSADLSKFDFALIDLELKALVDPPIYESTYDPSDLQGGSMVLPHLRHEAPWLPAIGYSHLFDPQGSDSVAAFSVASGFGFDSLVPRCWFGKGQNANRMTQESWISIFERSRFARARALFGDVPTGMMRVPEIRCSTSVSSKLDSLSDDWRGALQMSFHFATTVACEIVSPGHSGALVVRCRTQTHDSSGAQRGAWIVKFSINADELWKECRAHISTVRGGLAAAAGAALLWNGVAKKGACGLIAYQMLGSSVEAQTLVRKDGPLADTLKKIGSMLKEFYSGATVEDVPIDIAIGESLLSMRRIVEAAKLFPRWALGQGIVANSEGNGELLYSRVLRVSFARIHRDLHLRNILVGASASLIDFAHAKRGPVVYDIARLITDLLILLPDTMQHVRVLSLDDLEIKKLFESLDPPEQWRSEDNELLLSYCLEVCFAQAQSYDGIGIDAKDKIASLLQQDSLDRRAKL